MGGKSKLTPAKMNVAEEIIERLSNGEPLRAICRDEHMPSWRAFYEWMERDADFAARIAHARELGFDAIAQQALEIADSPLIGVRREQSDTGTKITEEDMLGHRKLQVETRLKLLAKWCPKKYGDKVQQEITNPDGSLRPQKIIIEAAK